MPRAIVTLYLRRHSYAALQLSRRENPQFVAHRMGHTTLDRSTHGGAVVCRLTEWEWLRRAGPTWSPCARPDVPLNPAGGFRSDEEIAHLPGANRIELAGTVAGPSPEVYAVYRGTAQRNLYRVLIR
jgi:hypothetical protein